MAHNIEINEGVASFAENGSKKRAWHGLGDKSQIFDRPMFVEEALKACHADYEVNKQPIVALTPQLIETMAKGEMINPDDLLSLVIPDFKATMRMDKNKILGLVGESYGVVQNIEAFKFIDMLCSGKIADRSESPTIESCGVLGNGERVFVCCKMPNDIILNSKTDDRIERYIMITTSHNGLGAVRVVLSPVRVVCQNTLNLALNNNSGRISFRHTANVLDRMDLTNTENAKFAYGCLNLEKEYNDYFKAELEHLKNIKICEKQLNDILAEVVLSEESLKVYKETNNINHDDIATRGRNIFNGMKNAIHYGVGQEFLESGNGLWLINGITSYYQNNANYKNDEVKFISIMDGNVSKKVQKAYELVAAI